jgi:hypothetical protein
VGLIVRRAVRIAPDLVLLLAALVTLMVLAGVVLRLAGV